MITAAITGLVAAGLGIAARLLWWYISRDGVTKQQVKELEHALKTTKKQLEAGAQPQPDGDDVLKRMQSGDL